MTSCSMLYEKPENHQPLSLDAPSYYKDLNLDQVIDAITVRKKSYNLEPFYFTPLQDINTIRYRQEIGRDLDDERLLEKVKEFAQKMTIMHRYLGMVEELEYPHHKEGWFLEAVAVYCEAVTTMATDLDGAVLHSRGLLEFRDYINKYSKSQQFTHLHKETLILQDDLSNVKYCVIIKGGTFKVRNYEMESDYSEEVVNTFDRFKQGVVKNYLSNFHSRSGMNHVERKILEFVAKLNPEIFFHLDQYYTENVHFLDNTIATFEREIQFFVSYLDYIADIRRAGLDFCYPEISSEEKDVFTTAGFDLALAYKLISEQSLVVCNDFYIKGKERIIVVSGPNQGGKTTFARMFGQLHYLGSLGLPIPGHKARIFLFDQIFTHFEKEEIIKNLRGKLQDDLVRVHEILNLATTKSLIIINEIFTSTTLNDAIYLGRNLMEKIIALDLLCVCVTFIDELASLGEKTVSMVSTIVPDNPALRTFKIIRKPADGIAYAISIAEKYHLTYDTLGERIKP